MRSAFQGPRRSKITATSKLVTDENYDLRGLNLTAPDQVMPTNETPVAQNCRMYAREDGETRVAIRTRKGSIRLSTPVGETANVENVAAADDDVEVKSFTWVQETFEPDASGLLTKFELEVKQTFAGSGSLIVEIFSDSGGELGELLGQSSIPGNTITSSFQYLGAHFMDAPSLLNGETYWVRARGQRTGTAIFALRGTAAAGAQVTLDEGDSLSSLGQTFRYKTYLSPAGTIKGFTRRYPLDNEKRTVFAMGTNVYSVPDTGTPTSISSAIHADATKVRFAHADDNTIWVDGFYTPKKWDGTTVSNLENAPADASHVWIHQNRAFFVPASDPNRVEFSNLYDFETYSSTDFFYASPPKSADNITGGISFQNNLVIFTHETKYVVYGTDLRSFTREEALGTKGAISEEAIAADRNYIYFMADDRNIYRWNGNDDEILSERVEPLLRSIPDVSKVRFHIYRNQLRVYFPTGADNQAEDMLLLELSKRDSNKYLQWFRDTGRAVGGSLEWYLDDNELIEFSSKTGTLYRGEVGENDAGKVIDFKYYTAYKAYGSGSAKDRIKRFRPYIRPTSMAYQIYIGKDVDFENNPALTEYTVDPGGTIWGGFVWNDGSLWGGASTLVDEKVAMSGRGKFTQFRFECNQLDTPVELYGYMALIKSGRVR